MSTPIGSMSSDGSFLVIVLSLPSSLKLSFAQAKLERISGKIVLIEGESNDGNNKQERLLYQNEFYIMCM